MNLRKIVSGVAEFRGRPFEERQALFAELANGQSPEVLFVTCADSRIDPCLITQTEPGDLFICRNAGNVVPPHSHLAGGETASVEYAVAVLGVQDIIVCGHTDCGAVKGAMNPRAVADLPQVSSWLEHIRAAVEIVDENPKLAGDDRLLGVIEQNVLLQLQHLRTHPAVAARVESGAISLHGWVYHIETGAVTTYDETAGCFVPMEQRYADVLEPADSMASVSGG